MAEQLRMTPLSRAQDAFSRHFGDNPRLCVRAPGRVNLIGEHTDYNDGFVLPCAIDFHTVACGSARRDGRVRLVAVDCAGERDEFAVDEPIGRVDSPRWANYVRGVVQAVIDAGHRLTGADIAISGDIPQGAGLSSSASLVVAIGQFFNVLDSLSISDSDIALFGQRAENRFVGAQTGIMDQLISVKGKEGHALLIDCRSLETVPVAMPAELSILIVDSRVPRGLVESAYNARRRQCEEAARHFGVKALRDVDMSELEANVRALDPVVYRRARHVITDSQRAIDLAAALRGTERHAIGTLMAASHASMRDDFEITVPPIDTLVQIVKDVVGDGGGARMTGGGFGGCVVSLAPHELVEPVREAVIRRYRAATNRDAVIHVCRPSGGASICS
jgi:galactokinase